MYKINFEDKNDFIVSVSGDLDINTVNKFKDQVIEKYKELDKNIVFDFENLEYIDSTGLGAIISIYKFAQEKNKDIVIKNARKNIKKLFFITELDKIFRIEE